MDRVIISLRNFFSHFTAWFGHLAQNVGSEWAILLRGWVFAQLVCV